MVKLIKIGTNVYFVLIVIAEIKEGVVNIAQ